MIRVKLDDGAFAPKQAHSTDAGYDLRARESATVPAHGSAVFDTGVHFEVPPGFCGILISKSGLNVNHDITSTGLIDDGYTGSIRVKLYNHGDDDYHVERGDKISQLVLVGVLHEGIDLVDELHRTERGDCGFGSTGR